MKIAIITELFIPSIGGQEVRYMELGSQLVLNGNEVHVYTMRLSSNTSQYEAIDGISVHRITNAYNYKTSFWGTRNLLDIVRFTKDVMKIRAELDSFDALIFNKWPLLPPIVYPRLTQNMCIVDWCEIRPSRLWHFVYRLMANKNVKHIGVSQAICDYLHTVFDIPSSHLYPILSGIYSDNYLASISEKEDKTILFFGRLSEHKDPVILIESFISGHLAEKGYALHIAGGGPLLAEIKARYGDISNLFIHGVITDETKIELLKKSTLLVLPSKREGFPRVIAEAAAAGTPTLTTDYPGNGSVSVVAQYQIGWTCAPDINVLAASIAKHAVINDEWRIISANCIKAGMETFDWNNICGQLTKYIGEDV